MFICAILRMYPTETPLHHIISALILCIIIPLLAPHDHVVPNSLTVLDGQIKSQTILHIWALGVGSTGLFMHLAKPRFFLSMNRCFASVCT